MITPKIFERSQRHEYHEPVLYGAQWTLFVRRLKAEASQIKPYQVKQPTHLLMADYTTLSERHE